MTQLLQTAIRNKLLSALSPFDFARLSPHLEPVTLPRLYELASPGLIANYCYFLETGIGSIVAEAHNGRKAEIGMFGREGMSPTSLVLHAPSAPFSTFMQIAGHGYRLQSIQLSHALEESFSLRTLLLRFAQVMTVQASFTALSNATDRIEQRLARWLLMCHDRSDGQPIALTHAFVSDMLAVRRQSITTALHVLEGNHLISAERNQITIEDRHGLEEFAGAAYGPAEDTYRRLIGAF
ncbi:Crp/Fnr family transcriptional regulator [Agrobacterium rubi]|uniref:Crp/Fnr family transcriptional regulator n=3 Tax=Agrobacterium rubi TaxID=28099 RepID=A0AAE7RE20_9HYPH|nr:Crp/Fnr family transcriptional regulator [Agrobacterium rubi]GAK73054.1 putative DNA-binding protein [Agrobacterium rubi TR3 = NBRC 13261]NTE89039.1 Crp/Fnr family transcriptional regulator [Agrobacterium rubi]NTF04260.1 Crp/Fnr family transcriptional regulator [Agrobacterium rubi]NTF09674.1 Crp/Fnr family transcriptional regulator [Agrobacterium rubi]NTF22581.1 Crp/Fnr family transcriptional regulator [Agrobacterium rubi]